MRVGWAVGGRRSGEPGALPVLRTPGPRQLAHRSSGPASGRDGGDQATTLPRSLVVESAAAEARFHPYWGRGLEMGSRPLSGSPIMAWHQHLDCRLLCFYPKWSLREMDF